MTEITHEVKPESIAEDSVQYVPSVYIEVSKEQLDLLEVGKDVTIKLIGKVKRLEASEHDKANNRYEISMELQEVSIDPKENEFSELADD